MGELAQKKAPELVVGENGMAPRTIEEGYRLAQYIQASGVSREKPETILIQMQAGMELGIPPMAAIKNIPIIKGKPFIETSMAAALVESKGMLQPGTKIVAAFDGTGKDRVCTVTSTPVGGQPITSQLRFGDLPNANNNALYKTMPDRMHKARAVGFHVRDYYAAATLGLMFVGEQHDMAQPAMRDVTPVPTPDNPDPLLEMVTESEPVETATIVDEPEPDHADFLAEMDGEQ